MNAVVQFELSEDCAFFLNLTGDSSVVNAGRHPTPNLTIASSQLNQSDYTIIGERPLLHLVGLAMDGHSLTQAPNSVVTDFKYYLWRLLDLETAVFLPILVENVFDWRIQKKTALAFGSVEQLMSKSAENDVRTLPHQIFGTDYCGSTLLARALSRLGVWCHNEPEAIADIAFTQLKPTSFSQSANFCLKFAMMLYGKVPEGYSIAVIKNQSITNSIMPNIFSLDTQMRGVFLCSQLDDFLASVLKSKTRRDYIRKQLAALDNLRLPCAEQCITAGLSDAQIAAQYWCKQMEYASEIHELVGPRILLVSQQSFVDNPIDVLRMIAVHFNLGNPSSEMLRHNICDVVRSDVFSTYSKDSTHRYDASDRQRYLKEHKRQFCSELRTGIKWAEYYLSFNSNKLAERFWSK